MLQEKLAEYARLVVRVGANLQKGQTFILNCPVECAQFGRLLASEAYAAGARDVVLRWQDDALDRMRYLCADDAVFDEVPAWIKAFFEEYSNPQNARVTIFASDPEHLRDAAPDRIQRSTIASGNALKKYKDMQLNNEFPWCIISVPTEAWAAKMFPGIPGAEAVDMLWNAIFQTMRITGDGSANEKWLEHLALLNSRAEILNNYHFTRLLYKNGLGTDLSVELPKKHIWLCGGENSKAGIPFVANMPTEELFTLPMKNGVNGVVYSSMPLSLNGNLIKDIVLTLKDGRIVNAEASEGLEVLLRQLDTDGGARYFGEVALVPYDSAISKQGILYYNTLFDENASCHFAFGTAYPAFEDAGNMTPEEKAANGANDSIVHEDFMVGTPDLSIIGVTADGRRIPVFTDGNFSL